jgi:hypothetical protein
MIEKTKIEATHLARLALVYVRQSTATQLERNKESTDRQYRLVERAIELGWKREQIIVIDEDLGRSGSGLVERSGFDKMTSDVALGRVGIILGLEVSRFVMNHVLLPNSNHEKLPLDRLWLSEFCRMKAREQSGRKHRQRGPLCGWLPTHRPCHQKECSHRVDSIARVV